jgi:hypothetical protein
MPIQQMLRARAEQSEMPEDHGQVTLPEDMDHLRIKLLEVRRLQRGDVLAAQRFLAAGIEGHAADAGVAETDSGDSSSSDPDEDTILRRAQQKRAAQREKDQAKRKLEEAQRYHIPMLTLAQRDQYALEQALLTKSKKRKKKGGGSKRGKGQGKGRSKQHTPTPSAPAGPFRPSGEQTEYRLPSLYHTAPPSRKRWLRPGVVRVNLQQGYLSATLADTRGDEAQEPAEADTPAPRSEEISESKAEEVQEIPIAEQTIQSRIVILEVMEAESLSILAMGTEEPGQVYTEDLHRIHLELASLTRTLRSLRARRIMDALTEPAPPRIGVEHPEEEDPDLSPAVTALAPTATAPNPALDPAPPSSTPSAPHVREEDIDVDWGAPQEIELEALSREEQRTRGWIDEPQFGMEGW